MPRHGTTRPGRVQPDRSLPQHRTGQPRRNSPAAATPAPDNRQPLPAGMNAAPATDTMQPFGRTEPVSTLVHADADARPCNAVPGSTQTASFMRAAAARRTALAGFRRQAPARPKHRPATGGACSGQPAAGDCNAVSRKSRNTRTAGTWPRREGNTAWMMPGQGAQPGSTSSSRPAITSSRHR